MTFGKKILTTAFICMFGLLSCATPQPQITAGTNLAINDKVEAQKESKAFKEIQTLFSKNKTEALLNKITLYKNNFAQDQPFSNSVRLAQVYNIHGLIFLLTQQPLFAILQFKKAIELDPSPSFSNFVLYNLATAEFESNEIKDSSETLEKINFDILDPLTKEKYSRLKAKILSKSDLKPEIKPSVVPSNTDQAVTPTPVAIPASENAIGILLPNKGKYAKFANQSLHAIELAFRTFSLDEPDSKYTLILEDSGETPEQTLQALNLLYEKHHVIAVIGPLLSKGIEMVTKRTEELGLPLISLAQQNGGRSKFVFQAAVTPKLQTHEIAQYAVQSMGLHRFAILQPKDKFGEQMSQAFWDEIENLGGEIVGIEPYPSDETDFRQYIDKLSGLFYSESRQEELDALAQTRLELKIKKRNRKTEKYFNLKPIVDYEAVFIPDEPKNIGQILPTFAYRDVEKIKFLGISTWNSPELLSRSQNYVEGAVFLDSYYSEDESPKGKEFREKFKLIFQEEPSSIEAIAFDAASILIQTLDSLKSKARHTLRDQLADVSNFPGITGNIRYKDGQWLRNLNILTVHKGHIEPVQR